MSFYSTSLWILKLNSCWMWLIPIKKPLRIKTFPFTKMTFSKKLLHQISMVWSFSQSNVVTMFQSMIKFMLVLQMTQNTRTSHLTSPWHKQSWIKLLHWFHSRITQLLLRSRHLAVNVKFPLFNGITKNCQITFETSPGTSSLVIG